LFNIGGVTFGRLSLNRLKTVWQREKRLVTYKD
jgi:hypothetical protein